MQDFLYKFYKTIKSSIINLLPSHLGKTTREFRFYKDVNDRWYVDLPEWQGPKWNLKHFENANILIKYKDDAYGDGADYKYDVDSQLWLCGVTSWYYGSMPERIYYRKVLD